ncbi:MAG TPA: molybdenum cofactor guanylyltransferase [Thermomicrobiales bacterium]|nr:molybdenum cofactor guanylyltransferase [Thermomicrobiales bacterium]
MLIGGRSRRMGGPKALLRLAPGEPTLLELVAGAMSEVASDVTLVGRASWPIPESLAGLHRVRDEGNGAADGVVAALRASRFDECLVVGCDMPFLNVALLREMGTLSKSEGRGVIVSESAGLHPLHAVYRRKNLARIESVVATGERSLVAIVQALGMAAIDLDVPERDSAVRWSVFNVNTPEDLETARAHAGV